MLMLRWCVLWLLVAGLVACGGSDGQEAVATLPPLNLTPLAVATRPAESLDPLATRPLCTFEEPLRLGAVLSLSGPAADQGRVMQQGIELAVRHINEQGFLGPDATLEVLIEDDQGDKDQAAVAFMTLMRRDEVLGLLGPTLAEAAIAAHPQAQAEGVPVIATSITDEQLTEGQTFIFRNALNQSEVIPNTINEAQQALGLRRVYLLYDESDEESVVGYEVMQAAAEIQGLEIWGTGTFTTGQQSWAGLLAQVEAEQPDALLVSAQPDEAAALMWALSQREMALPVIGGEGFTALDFLRKAGPAAEGAITGAAWAIDNPSPENQAFVDAYHAAYARDPSILSAQAYTGVWLFAHALRNACTTDRTALRDALARLRLVPTPLGLYSFTTDRNPLHPPASLIVEERLLTRFDVPAGEIAE